MQARITLLPLPFNSPPSPWDENFSTSTCRRGGGLEWSGAAVCEAPWSVTPDPNWGVARGQPPMCSFLAVMCACSRPSSPAPHRCHLRGKGGRQWVL